MSIKVVLKFTICLVWLSLMGWLIRYEAYPHLFDETMQGYRELSRDLPALRDTWLKVMHGDRHVGYLHSSIEMLEEEGEELLQMSNQVIIRIDMQGQVDLFRLDTESRLDARHNLIGSDSSFSLGQNEVRLKLLPQKQPGDFELLVSFKNMQLKKNISLPRSVVISSPFMDAGMHRVKPGKTKKIRVMNPFSHEGELSMVEVTGLSEEIRVEGGLETTVSRIRITYEDWVMEAEVDEFGRLLRQETPFGITLLKAEAGDAMKVPRENSVDLLSLLSEFSLPNFLKSPVDL